MVFGWGKKKEAVEPRISQTINIKLSDVQDTASELLEKRRTKTVTEINTCRNQIIPLLAELTDIGNKLENDNLKIDDIDRNIRVVVIRGKQHVISVIKKDIVPLPTVSTFDDAEALHDVLNQTLKKIGDALGRQTRVIHLFAKKYATVLKEVLAEVNSNNAEINTLLQNFEKYYTTFTEIDSSIKEIYRLWDFNSVALEKITSIYKDTIEHEDKIKECKNAIDEIESSPEYARLLKMKETLDHLVTKRVRLDSKILDYFAKISRPLSRYEYVSSLDKQQKILLSGLIRTPAEVLVADNKETITIILENVKKGIRSGSISVKDQTKSLSHISEVEEALDGIITEVSEYEKSHKDTTCAIEKLTPKDLHIWKRKLEKATTYMSTMKTKIKSLKEEIDANKTQIPLIVNTIEAKLRRFSNTQYTVVTEN